MKAKYTDLCQDVISSELEKSNLFSSQLLNTVEGILVAGEVVEILDQVKNFANRAVEQRWESWVSKNLESNNLGCLAAPDPPEILANLANLYLDLLA